MQASRKRQLSDKMSCSDRGVSSPMTGAASDFLVWCDRSIWHRLLVDGSLLMGSR